MLSVPDNVAEKDFHVNTLTQLIHEKRHIVLSVLVWQIVLSQQKTWLHQDLGPRFTRQRRQARFKCPKCKGRCHTRKGTRERAYSCLIGKLRLPVVQVRCLECRCRFCPYKDQIGLCFTDRISQSLVDKQLSLTCELPYWKARHFVQELLSVAVSQGRIRKQIDLEAESIESLDITAENQIAYIDSTKVPAGSKTRGETIHFAVTATPGKRGKRPVMNKRFLFLAAGNADAVRERTEALKLRGLVHDGDVDFTGCAQHIQRCLWHLPHQLKHFLWDDGVPHEDRLSWVDELIRILFGNRNSEEMMQQYTAFTDRLGQAGLPKSFKHLKNAEKELIVSRENDFPYHTTAPIEREMREINRRAEIGVRWSTRGVQNLLRVKMFRRLKNRP